MIIVDLDFNYYDYKKYKEIAEWCKINCKGNFDIYPNTETAFQFVGTIAYYRNNDKIFKVKYSFENESDAILFKLIFFNNLIDNP